MSDGGPKPTWRERARPYVVTCSIKPSYVAGESPKYDESFIVWAYSADDAIRQGQALRPARPPYGHPPFGTQWAEPLPTPFRVRPVLTPVEEEEAMRRRPPDDPAIGWREFQ